MLKNSLFVLYAEITTIFKKFTITNLAKNKTTGIIGNIYVIYKINQRKFKQINIYFF